MTGGFDRLRRIGIVLLVLTVVAQPLVGTAAASTTTATTPDEDCEPPDNLDRGVDIVLFGLDEVYGAAQDIWSSDDPECVDLRALQNATHADLYESALHSSDYGEATYTFPSNQINTSQTYVKTLVQAEATRAMLNNSTRQQAKDRVNESIENYYDTIRYNIIESWRSQANHAYYVWNTTQEYGIKDAMWSRYDDSDPLTGGSTTTVHLTRDDNQFQLAYNNTTLEIGGNTTTVPALDVVTSDGQLNQVYNPFNASAKKWDTEPFTGLLGVSDPQANPSQPQTADGYAADEMAVFLDEGQYRALWTEIDAAEQRAKDNAVALVDGVYDTYNQSDFDGTEIVDCSTLVGQFNTDLNSTGYYASAASSLSCLGLEGSVNDSISISYTPDGDGTAFEPNLTNTSSLNMSGTIFTSWEPMQTNGSFVVNTTYNTSNAGDEPVYFVWQESPNSTDFVRLDGEFTINSLTNVRTGESINSTTPEQNVQSTYNASLTQQELLDLLEYRDQQLEISSAGGGGGGGGFGLGGFSLGGAAVGGLLALGAAFLLLGDGIPGSGS